MEDLENFHSRQKLLEDKIKKDIDDNTTYLSQLTITDYVHININSSTNTNLSDLSSDSSVIIEVKPTTFVDIVYDLSLSIEERLQTILTKINDIDVIFEILSRLSNMYMFNQSATLCDYIVDLAKYEPIPFNLRLNLAMNLYSQCKTFIYLIESVFDLNPYYISEFTNCKIEAIYILFENDKTNISIKELTYILQDPKIDSKYKYSVLLSLQRKKINTTILFNLAYLFWTCKFTNIDVKILSCQLIYSVSNTNTIEELDTFLFSVASSSNYITNQRADCLDIIVKFSLCEDNRKRATQCLYELGGGKTKTIYDNSQNVHTVELESSVLDILLLITKVEYKNGGYPYSECKDKLLYEIKNESCDHQELIKISLSRIELDNALYGKSSCGLQTIFVKLMNYIESSDKIELWKRLIEELIEMSGVCSSGFVSRLVNVLSGHSDISVKISWEQQITANLYGRFNAKIRDEKDEDLRDKIMEEFSEKNKYTSRPNFLAFFRKNLPYIREELKQEFEQHINETDFDLYMMRAICLYDQ